MRNVFKTKFEYCHITDDKIIITKTPEVEDLITDYSKIVCSIFFTVIFLLNNIYKWYTCYP